MSNPHAAVKKTPLNVHKPAAAVQTLQAVVATGTASAAVQGSPIAKQALADLQNGIAPFNTVVTDKTELLNQLNAARKGLTTQFAAVEALVRNYETAVNTLAVGNAQIITGAGLLTRDAKTPAAALSPLMKDLRSTLGEAPKTAVLRWGKVAGATSYAIQVNWTPATPAGTWTALPSGSSRRRTVTAPAQGTQFLAEVAALASDGTQGPWSDPILVTAR
jgi:hypothetical protein